MRLRELPESRELLDDLLRQCRDYLARVSPVHRRMEVIDLAMRQGPPRDPGPDGPDAGAWAFALLLELDDAMARAPDPRDEPIGEDLFNHVDWPFTWDADDARPCRVRDAPASFVEAFGAYAAECERRGLMLQDTATGPFVRPVLALVDDIRARLERPRAAAAGGAAAAEKGAIMARCHALAKGGHTWPEVAKTIREEGLGEISPRTAAGYAKGWAGRTRDPLPPRRRGPRRRPGDG